MFDRTLLMLNEEDFKKIENLNILIVGIGGVGGSVLESLIRSGVANITIIDHDTFETSNLNRQILCTKNDIGSYKVDVAKNRMLNINSNAILKPYKLFLDDNNINVLDLTKFDYIIDACDTVTTKILLIKEAINNNIKIISSMGTGNRIDASMLEIKDISKTTNDPLAKIVRKLLKDNNIHAGVLTLCSNELPIKNGSRTPGSMYFVPNAAGILISSYIIKDTLNKKS